MTEHSGGHWLDTGEGPVSVDPPAGRAEDTAQMAAWRAYLDHVTAPCAECHARLWNCPEGKELWVAYKALHPLPDPTARRPA